MADKPHITRDGYVARLVRVGVWSTPQNPIQYAFLEQRPAYLPNEPGWTALSGAQRTAVERAFAMIAEVVNLTFVQVPDNQQQPGPGNPRINFYANSVELSYSGSMDAYQFDGSSAIYGADIRFNTSRIAQRQSNEGWQDFTSFVALHEVLHAMGLSHPGDYNGQGFNYQDHADFVEDTIQYSVMSYFSAANTGADHFIGNVLYGARTPLLYDILALQSLYSPNMNTRAGDTVYGFNSNTGATSPFNFAVTTGPVVAIWDGGGTDTIDLSGYGEASLIDLNEGAFSDAGGLTKNIAIAYNVTIENAVGGTGADRLIGNAVANRLDGGAGADLMEGGSGDDVYVVDDPGDVVVELAGAGADEVRTALAAYTLGANFENLTGTSSTGQSLTGNGLANVIAGGAGADQLAGGLGNDIYVVGAGDNVNEAANAGTDEVLTALSAYTLGANLERLTGTSATGQTLTGNGLSNLIKGGAGNDVIAGGSGADQLAGGLGDDVYTMDTSDTIIEAANAGIDEVRTAIAAYTLAANVEWLTGTSASGQRLTGNALANILSAGGGNDVLNGGLGADRMTGGGGNDIYVVDDAGDAAVEAAGGGIDTVQSLVSFTLGATLENLTLTGNAAINGTGNASANTIIGNGRANMLAGGDGNDVLNGGGDVDALNGGGGNDRLDGGTGSDTMTGGAGNDVYLVDNAGDRAVEAAGGGVDSVHASVGFVLGAEVENLTLTGGAAVSGYGNSLANLLTGNAAANSLWGSGGNDGLDGGGGNDVLHGGAGHDRLNGGAGADGFFFDTALDPASNVDRIVDFAAADDTIMLSRAIFKAIGAGTLAANAFWANTAAHDADDRIVYDSATGRIWYDADGNGAGAALLFAQVGAGTALSAADFFGV
jgi:Ca2+-binding RTX toxin-like protein